MRETSGFSRPDPIAYLDQVAASAPGQAYKQHVMDSLGLEPGQTVLDIGCGPGTDLVSMAAAVSPNGRVIGVDRDPAMVDEARARLAGQLLGEVRSGDAHALPLDEGSVDRARTDRVLQHVADPSRVLAEFRRVSRPGGRIVMAEPDWDGLLIDSPDRAVSRGLTRFITTEIVRNATIGRSLARLCVDAGLSVRSVMPSAPLFCDFETADQVLGLRRNVARAITAGYLDGGAQEWVEEAGSRPFLATALLFVVTAEVPA
ncbi:methyltransferase domain-containing protein [Spirillospora sp. NBC_00431]